MTVIGWLEGKKTLIAGLVVALLAAVGFWVDVVPADSAIALVGFGLVAVGLGDKSERLGRQLIAALAAKKVGEPDELTDYDKAWITGFSRQSYDRRSTSGFNQSMRATIDKTDAAIAPRCHLTGVNRDPIQAIEECYDHRARLVDGACPISGQQLLPPESKSDLTLECSKCGAPVERGTEHKCKAMAAAAAIPEERQ